jgi:hypothetical protein
VKNAACLSIGFIFALLHGIFIDRQKSSNHQQRSVEVGAVSEESRYFNRLKVKVDPAGK